MKNHTCCIIKSIYVQLFGPFNISFFCTGVVSREMFDSMQNAQIIGTLTKEFNEVRNEKWEKQ